NILIILFKKNVVCIKSINKRPITFSASNVTECPDGLHCTSPIPNHYKRYSSSLLAHSHALNGCTTQAISDFSLKSVNNVAPSSATEISVNSAVNVSASSSSSPRFCPLLVFVTAYLSLCVNSYISQKLSSNQTALSITQETPSMAPRRTQTKAGPSGLKQTDIGVFFGLKPLNEKKAEEEVKATVREANQQGSRRVRISEAQGEDAKLQGRRRRKSKAPSEVSSVSPAVEDGMTRPTQTEGKQGWRAERQKRWNRGRATDGDPKEPKRCPFYKKIPGTGFAVGACQYGVVEGITGNLVKSKLKVDEVYVHVLPMNTECILLVTNEHLNCPGAAMLLFVLPDGQTVLHTGDFRADPSMEQYPELQGLRIQTLYLDTTHCSPEYTFPTQQEVQLNPCTLVVCGTHAVGIEKVFLAVAEVLGSKVCLSKYKYNTMCCLESEEIGQLITTDWQVAQVHVLPMMQFNFKNLRTYLIKFSRQYDQLVAFKPTGWTFNQSGRVEDIQPQTQGNISIYGITAVFLTMEACLFKCWLCDG
uniref:DNA cross-link repair 1A (PSO2 homolog, S. cerevisiae) n=1 Tax=Cyprinus carpio TaxID=7962 RepID=A0A8C2EK59_CYPCA